MDYEEKASIHNTVMSLGKLLIKVVEAQELQRDTIRELLEAVKILQQTKEDKKNV